MTKIQIVQAINLSLQTVPFLTITALFVLMAYTYGNATMPFTAESAFEASKINLHYRKLN